MSALSKPTTFGELYSLHITQNIINAVRDATAVNGFKYLSVADVCHLFNQGLTIKEVWGFLNNDGSDNVLNSLIVPSNLNTTPKPFATIKTFMSAIPAPIVGSVGSNTIIDQVFDLKISSLLTYRAIMTYWVLGGAADSTAAQTAGWTAITDNSNNSIFTFSVLNSYNTNQVLSNLVIATADNGNSYAWLKSALASITRPAGVSLHAAFTSMIPISQRTGAVYTNADFGLSDLLEITNQNVRNSTGSNFMEAWTAILPFASGNSGAKVGLSTITSEQAVTAFRRVKSHGFLPTDIFASDLWKSSATGIVAFATANQTQTRLIINAFSSAYDNYLDTASLEDRLSWFKLFKPESSTTESGITTKVNANLSSLPVALTMLKDGDSLDAIFAYITNITISSVNTAWKTTQYTKKTSAASDFNDIKSLDTFNNFSAENFTSAVNFIAYFATTKTTISGTNVSTIPTNNLLKTFASGFGNNSVAYGRIVGSPIMYSYVTNVPIFAYAATNLAVALGSTGSFTTITLVAAATVTTFFSYIFGADITIYLRSNLTPVNSNSFTDNNNALTNNFSIAFSDSTKVSEVVDEVLKTSPVSGTGSIYGLTPYANLLTHATTLTTGVGSQIIDRVISLAKTDADHKAIHAGLTGTTLYTRMIAGTVSKVNVAKVYNYIAKYTTIAAAMTSTPATSTVITTVDANAAINSLRAAFPAYTATPSSPSIPGAVYNTNYEAVSNTKLLADFYAALDDNTVNAVLRTNAAGTAYAALSAGSWLNYLDATKVNIGKSITGFNSTSSTVDYIGYPLVNIFSTSMLYPTYSFNFSSGVQSSSVTYVQVVSGHKAVALGYSEDDVRSIINAPAL